MLEVKFCGLTRAVDAEHAVQLGATHVGVIFAGGPRLQTAATAREVLAPLAGTLLTSVGVFGDQDVDEVLRTADAAGVGVLQLTVVPSRDALRELRSRFSGEIWTVVHVAPTADAVDSALWHRADAADAAVLDAQVKGALGGTGVSLAWSALSASIAARRLVQRVWLAGGLSPENVETAVRAARPSGVDVSSGVERAPGIKDPERMRAFLQAVRACEV